LFFMLYFIASICLIRFILDFTYKHAIPSISLFRLCIKRCPDVGNTFNRWIEFVQSGPPLNPATFTNTYFCRL
jgi:hypothetical protein